MRSARLRSLGGCALAAASTILLAGCSGAPFIPQTPAQLAGGAAASWSRSPAFHFAGSLSVPEGTVRFTLTESADGGQGRGAGTLAGKPFTYLAASGNQYLKGQSFWQQYYGARDDHDSQTLAKGFGGRYTEAGGNDVAVALRELVLLGGGVDLLVSHAGSFKKGATRMIGGLQATRLMSGGETFWVVSGDPDLLVGFEAPRAGQLTDVNVTITTSKIPRVSAPPAADTADPLRPGTLPAHYLVVGASGNPGGHQCDQDSCVVQAQIVNQGGAPQGSSSVQITAQDPTSRGTVTSCTLPIPAVPPGQSQTLACTLSGPAWAGWAQNAVDAGGGSFVVGVEARITSNPPYVG